MTFEVIQLLINQANSNDLEKRLEALTHLGLLVERHTQNRYGETDYLILFNFREDLYNLKPQIDEISRIIHFFFYLALNEDGLGTKIPWCLGKCYGYDLKKGLIRLLEQATVDEVCLQYLMSISAMYDVEEVFDDLAPVLPKFKSSEKFQKTTEYINQYLAEGE